MTKKIIISPTGQLQFINEPAVQIYNEIPIGDVDGTNMVFELLYIPMLDSLRVNLNGLLQFEEAHDYTIAGKIITFSCAPELDSRVLVHYEVANEN